MKTWLNVLEEEEEEEDVVRSRLKLRKVEEPRTGQAAQALSSLPLSFQEEWFNEAGK